MQVLFDRLLVEPIEKEEETVVFMPESSKEKPDRGVVFAVGDGKPKEPMVVKAGDTIKYSRNSGISVEIEDKTYLLIKQSDVFLIE